MYIVQPYAVRMVVLLEAMILLCVYCAALCSMGSSAFRSDDTLCVHRVLATSSSAFRSEYCSAAIPTCSLAVSNAARSIMMQNSVLDAWKYKVQCSALHYTIQHP